MKRGYLPGEKADEMEEMLWAFFNQTNRPLKKPVLTLHQTTTGYRPNRVIYNIVRKNLGLPFSAKMSRPFYHMDHPHAFAESFYASKSFGLGNIQMSIVDNPNQQMVWSLIARGDNGPLGFSGGHPMRYSTSGHSPYTQTLHSKGTMIVLTAPTRFQKITDPIGPQKTSLRRANLWHLPKQDQARQYELANRQKYASQPLKRVEFPQEWTQQSLEEFWQDAPNSAATWFYFPQEITPRLINGIYLLETPGTYLALIPLQKQHQIVKPDQKIISGLKNRSCRKFFNNYGAIVFPGQVSGYILEITEKENFASPEKFIRTLQTNTLKLVGKSSPKVSYQTLVGDLLELNYQPKGLRGQGKINGKAQHWDQLTQGAVYLSPYVEIKNGVMRISDGQESYQVDFTGSMPVWKELKH